MNSNAKKLLVAAGLVAIVTLVWLWLRPQPAPTPVSQSSVPVRESVPLPVPSAAPKTPVKESVEERPEVELRLLALTMSPTDRALRLWPRATRFPMMKRFAF